MFKLFYVFAQDSVFSSSSSILLTVFILNTCTTVVYVNFSKNSFQPFLSKRGAKVRIFIFIFQIFSKVFSIYFFRSLFRNDLWTFAWIFQPHPSVSIFPGSLTPLSSCHHRISLDCGCKSTAVKHILQMFSQLFYNYFLLSLIVNDLQIHFSPFFWLDTKETKTQGYTTKATNSLRSTKIPVTRAPRSDSRDFFTLHSKFALRLLR